ncbi:mCG147539 [Mus musculus]|nr:mCG147539 [Mus musculus]
MRMKHFSVIEGIQDKGKIGSSLLFLNFSLFIHGKKSHGYIGLLILILHCVPIFNTCYNLIDLPPKTSVQQNTPFLPLRYLKRWGPE